jgi:anti-repressor protein
MSNLINFEYEGKDIRTVQIDGVPYFVAKDVCEVLEISNVSDAIKRLDEDEKLISTLSISGQNREVLLVNESGLYSLILTSRKPEAKKFKKWITGEVIPSIRKTGEYILEIKPKDPLLQLSEALIFAKQIIDDKDKYIAELEPKAEFADLVTNSDNKFKMDEVCSHLKLTIGRNKFFALLRADGILKGDNSPKREHIDNGNFVTVLKETPIGMKSVTLVTGKGLEYLSRKYDHIRLKAI